MFQNCGNSDDFYYNRRKKKFKALYFLVTKLNKIKKISIIYARSKELSENQIKSVNRLIPTLANLRV